MSDRFIKAKILFDRGRYWVNYLIFLMVVFVTATSMKQYEMFAFLSSSYWIAFVLLGSVLFMGVLGYIELHKLQTYQKEAEYLAKLNPVQARMLDNQDKIMKRLDRLEKARKL